jgi:hypothetical protein
MSFKRGMSRRTTAGNASAVVSRVQARLTPIGQAILSPASKPLISKVSKRRFGKRPLDSAARELDRIRSRKRNAAEPIDGRQGWSNRFSAGK